MENFKVLKEKIKAYNYRFGVSKSGEFLECGKCYNNNLEIVPEPPVDEYEHNVKTACDLCIFDMECSEAKLKWLYEPYQKPIVNVSRFDYELAKALKSKNFHYVIRDCNEILQVGVHAPVLNDEDSGAEFWTFLHYDEADILSQSISSCAFPYIVFENESPTLLSDIITAYEAENEIIGESKED